MKGTLLMLALLVTSGLSIEMGKMGRREEMVFWTLAALYFTSPSGDL